MGGKQSTIQPSCSKRKLKTSNPKRSRNSSGTSREATGHGCLNPICLKMEKKRQKKQMGLIPREEELITMVKKMIIIEQQNRKEVQKIMMDLNPPEKKITTVRTHVTLLEQKQMNLGAPPASNGIPAVKKLTLEDWIRGSWSPMLDPLTNSAELRVFKAFSRKKVYPSARTERPDENLRKKEDLREISGSFERACEYFQALDKLEEHATVRISPSPDRSRSLNIDDTLHRDRGETHWMTEWRRKVDGREREVGPWDGSRTSLLRRSESNNGRSRRRVTFRVPEESEIIEFYSPRDTDSNGNRDDECECGSEGNCGSEC